MAAEILLTNPATHSRVGSWVGTHAVTSIQGLLLVLLGFCRPLCPILIRSPTLQSPARIQRKAGPMRLAFSLTLPFCKENRIRPTAAFDRRGTARQVHCIPKRHKRPP